MNKGLVLYNNIFRLIQNDIKEDSAIESIKSADKEYFPDHRVWCLISHAIRYQKYNCVKTLVKVGFSSTYSVAEFLICLRWRIFQKVLPVVFCFGFQMPKRLDMIKACKSLPRKHPNTMKLISFIEKMRSCANNARKAALTFLAIRRFKRNNHITHCMNMDVVRMIAQTIYESGTIEWNLWETRRRKSKSLQKKRKTD